MIHPNQTTEVNPMSTITFVCAAYGNPVPSIIWNRGNAELANDSRITIYDELVMINGVVFSQSILVLCSAEESDTGNYSCFAENVIGNDSAKFVLSLAAQGEFPKNIRVQNMEDMYKLFNLGHNLKKKWVNVCRWLEYFSQDGTRD